MRTRHAAASTWAFPPERADDPRRVNLREWAARGDLFEHHLVVVARAGGAQLECPTASEPLYFAHANHSDEYALPLPTGDPLLDLFQGRTFLTDGESGVDVGRYKQGCFDLALHPHGLLHWPGRLRPPYQPFRFGPGMRRRGLSLVACASSPVAPRARPLAVTSGREADAKRERADVPLHLVDTRSASPGVIAVVADATLELVVDPARVAPPAGGYLLVLASHRDDLAACDLVYLAPGRAIDDARGVARAILFSAPTPPEPPSWDDVPPAPFAPFEDAPPGRLPLAIDGVTLDAIDDARVRIAIGDASAEVPRYWLARHLFRVALHGFRLGYTETYEGLYIDERADAIAIGLRGRDHVRVPRARAAPTIEAIYRAVAPAGYTERLGA